ncbi:hypothetical protein [Aestuariicoccus sp. MJ-SS9]|uniref:hypothetical protein n=1 Tax=Aestuariicoccus sp. MJ-SS9 TaxID=3079855 RepID=UPI00290DD0C4|nr:hypothetical protein [Aestuariicoccus sp. MJ-SS9]MDU8912976.1 hypothetical protein [Aestuariicoccus sp. MJ-SS9]
MATAIYCDNAVWGFTLLAIAQAMAGQATAAAETVAALRQKHPRFNLGVFRRHEPYRDAETLNRLTALLANAGLSE